MPSATYTFVPKPKSLVQVSNGGNYTIVAGEFAKVSVSVKGSGTFSIDGTIVLKGHSYTTSGPGNLQSSTNAGITSLITTGGGGTFTIANIFQTTTVDHVNSNTYNVPTGTVLLSTGDCQFNVERYDE